MLFSANNQWFSQLQMLLWVVVLTTAVHFSRVVMTMICVDNKVFRIPFCRIDGTHTPRFLHITPHLIDLHWLSLCQRIDFKCLLVFNCHQTGFSPYFHSGLTPYSCIQNTRHSNPSSNYLTIVSFDRTVPVQTVLWLLFSLLVLLSFGTISNPSLRWIVLSQLKTYLGIAFPRYHYYFFQFFFWMSYVFLRMVDVPSNTDKI